MSMIEINLSDSHKNLGKEGAQTSYLASIKCQE